ncbi:membrane-spanning 4-domains subfamily A member 15-like [Pyxicephalus adspersus]|uniref:membrane-spanning 4-domains subfamily A member 15-like n=1 Tax=Pyxicephalus adspersus TaxID=30357 RepID=UPI003B5BF067
MSSQVKYDNQQSGNSALDDISPPPYESIGPSDCPIYPSNIPPPNPGWNIYNVPLQPITTANFQQWNSNPVPTMSPMPQSCNVLPGTVTPQNTDQTLFQQTYLKGKPKVLGNALLVLAFLQAAFGIGLLYSIANFMWKSYIPFWGAGIYATTGSLVIKAQRKVKISQVKRSLAFTILTLLVSTAAIILHSIDFSHTDCDFTGNYFEYEACLQRHGVAIAILSGSLVLNVILFGVTIFISILSCLALSNVNSDASQVYIMQNGTVYPIPSTAVHPATVPSARSVYTQPELPPPY